MKSWGRKTGHTIVIFHMIDMGSLSPVTAGTKCAATAGEGQPGGATGNLSEQARPNPKYVAWFENGQVVKDRQDWAPDKVGDLHHPAELTM